MSHVFIGSAFIQNSTTWPTVRDVVLSKSLAMQYDFDDDGNGMGSWTIWALDNPIVYVTTIWSGSIPNISDVSQATNDAYEAEFTGSWLGTPYINLPINNIGSFYDPRMLHKFGNMTTTAVTERLVSALTYSEQASQAQRSVVSTNAQDSSGGSGAKEVKIVFLNSNYIKKEEIVTLNGTTPVNTINTDIRFIESFTVVRGAAAAGTIMLKINTGGTGGNICGIGSSTTDAFLCHHYVPSGSVATIYGWGGSVSDDISFKLNAQLIVSGNKTDQIIDLDNLTGITAGANAKFYRNLYGVKIGQQCYIRITAVPGQATSTITRAFLDIWETRGILL